MDTFHYERIYYVSYDVVGKKTTENKYITEQQLRWLTNRLEVTIWEVRFIWEIVEWWTYNDFEIIFWFEDAPY